MLRFGRTPIDVAARGFFDAGSSTCEGDRRDGRGLFDNHHRETLALVYPNVLAEINGVAREAFSLRRMNSWLPEIRRMSTFNAETLASIRSKFMIASADLKVR